MKCWRLPVGEAHTQPKSSMHKFDVRSHIDHNRSVWVPYYHLPMTHSPFDDDDDDEVVDPTYPLLFSSFHDKMSIEDIREMIERGFFTKERYDAEIVSLKQYELQWDDEGNHVVDLRVIKALVEMYIRFGSELYEATKWICDYFHYPVRHDTMGIYTDSEHDQKRFAILKAMEDQDDQAVYNVLHQ